MEASMAAIDVQAIIKRAYIDDTFRLGLMRDFDGTISRNALQLTPDERKELSAIDWEHFGTLVGGGGTWVHVYKSAA
jgi:hypothetical protein